MTPLFPAKKTRYSGAAVWLMMITNPNPNPIPNPNPNPNPDPNPTPNPYQVHGAAARLSEHNQLCRLDADGLCSAGPKMLPDSGVYRIEFEIVQATDGDGAYIGMIKPDANRSSYPGSDDKGIGWRAKGGVRHLHNTVDVGGPIAGWGAGDRVGLLLDTHACELCFVKNGRLLEQRYPVSLGGGMYFAVGRYYGSYVVRCLYMQQQGDNGDIDFAALGRVCRWVAAPGNVLEHLAIGANQLTGVSRFHGGQRNEAGLRMLLEAVGQPSCRLTHLDVSGNGLSEADAAAVLAVALGPASAIQTLRIYAWLVPVHSALAAQPRLDLSSHQMEDNDAALLARLLPSRPQLTALDLAANRLELPGVRAIADAIAASGTPLRRLSVARNRLGVRGVAALLRALGRAETHTLTALDLSHNALWSEAGSSAAAAIPAEVSSEALTQLGALMATPGCVLQELDLSCTGLSAAEAEASTSPHARSASPSPSPARQVS